MTLGSVLSRRVSILGALATVALLVALAAPNAQAINEPPCSGPGSIAFYAGPPLPLPPSGNGFYESNPTYTVPAADQGGWHSSTPGAQGMNGATLQSGIDWLSSNYQNLRSVLVARNGYLVEEQYFHGGAATRADNIHSASKSIIQALVGIAIQKGYIGSVNDAVSQYLPGLPPNERSITIAEMLDMQSGLTWTEDSSELQVQAHSNWVRAILNLGMSGTPGTGNFDYSTGNFHVLSAVLTAATGISTCQFAESTLFGAVGIYPAHWGMDPTTGVDMGGCDLYMTPRALALFAQLYVSNGVWGGRQIVPTATVRQAATATHNDGGGFYYDSGWWSRTPKHVPMYLAWGYNGQFGHVIPSLGVVLVTTENTQDGTAPFKEVNSGYFIKNYLIPSIQGPARRKVHHTPRRSHRRRHGEPRD